MLNSTAGMIKISKKSVFSSKANVQLPSINKTLDINQQKIVRSNTSVKSNFKNKVQLFIKDMEYEQMSEGEIHNEYKKLRIILKQFNDEIAQILQKNDYTNIIDSPKKIDIGKVIQVRDREGENNIKILEFYQLEYAKLLKRQQSIDESSKESIHSQISKIRQAIQTVKSQIRDISKTNFKRGNDILDSDSIVKQMKKLTQEKVLLQEKKSKTQAMYNKVIEQIKQSAIKSNDITDQYQKAQKVLKQLQLKDNDGKNNKKLQMQLIQKKINLENIKKKIESSTAFNQQKYLSKLKELDATNSRILAHTQKSIEIDQEIKNSKKTIKQLQGKRNILKQTNSNSQTSFEQQQSPLQVKTQTKNYEIEKKANREQIQQEGSVQLKKEKLLKRLEDSQYHEKFETYTDKISQKE